MCPVKDKIFICYRRGDTAGFAYTIHERLARKFGEERLFMDVDSIAPGADFIEAIEKAIPDSAVVLALIGQRWNPERLRNPQDFVRLELLTALKHGTRIIPVLLEDMEMPGGSELPMELTFLARRNAVKIRYNSDINRLVDSLDRILSQESTEEIAPTPDSFFTARPQREQNIPTPKPEIPAVPSTPSLARKDIPGAQSIQRRSLFWIGSTIILLIAFIPNFYAGLNLAVHGGVATLAGIPSLLAFGIAGTSLGLSTLNLRTAARWLLIAAVLNVGSVIVAKYSAMPDTEQALAIAGGLSATAIYIAVSLYYWITSRRS